MQNSLSAHKVLKSSLVNSRDAQASAIHEECIKNLAKECYKYHLFRNCVAVKKMDCKEYKIATVQKALSSCRLFIKDGSRDKHMSKLFYKTINDLRAVHFAVLTPSEKDKYKPHVKTKRNEKLTGAVPKPFEVENKAEDDKSRSSVEIILRDNELSKVENPKNYEKYVELLKQRIEITDKIVKFLEEEFYGEKSTN